MLYFILIISRKDGLSAGSAFTFDGLDYFNEIILCARLKQNYKVLKFNESAQKLHFSHTGSSEGMGERGR